MYVVYKFNILVLRNIKKYFLVMDWIGSFMENFVKIFLPLLKTFVVFTSGLRSTKRCFAHSVCS